VGPTAINNPEFQPNAIFLQGPDGSFADVAPAWGLDQATNDHGLNVVDLNGDGWLDLLFRDLDGPARIYMARCGEASWLQVDLVDPLGERDAIGARVQVELDGVTETRWIQAGSVGFASSSPSEAHFGLGAATAADVLRVRWPDGVESVFHDVAANRRVTVVRDTL
jgi:hypothetical protein